MIKVHYFTFNGFQENTYILYDETKECVIIDPGCYSTEEQQHLRSFIEENELKPVQLLNTHCHIDHILGNNFVHQTFNVDLAMHKDDLPTLHATVEYGGLYGFTVDPSPEPAVLLNEGDKVKFGNSELDVLFTPGHAPGHVVFVAHQERFVINGDVLFQGSIGRTDLPGGDFDTLIDSIKNKMFTLGDDYRIYTGHGPYTTVGHEKLHNPFVRE